MRVRSKRRTARLLAAVLLAGTLAAIPARAADDTATDYIIKYKQGAAWLQSDDRWPFEVVSKNTMQCLRFLGLLEWYEPDGVGELLDDAPAFYEPEQWNLDLVQASGAFESGHHGGGVRIGVVDSGVNPHPDLGDRLLPGCNCMDDNAKTEDTADNYGHGTKVAGLIAGAGERGYIGVAPEAEIVPLKITDGKELTVSAICRAIYAGIDDFDCNILNLSLGVTGEFEALREAVDYAEAQNVTIVSAVGNVGRTTVYYPAGYESVIGVGAVDQNGDISSRSNHNESVFLTAPGVDVRSTAYAGAYSLCTGTSFAVPQVSGATAVLLGIDPTLTPAQLRALLARSAVDRGDEDWDAYYGYGILNVAGSVAALTGEEEPPDTPCSFLPESGPARELRNNTDAPLDVIYLLAAYDERGVCLGVTSGTLTLPAHGTVAILPPPDGARYGQFVCETATMTPLAKERKTP